MKKSLLLVVVMVFLLGACTSKQNAPQVLSEDQFISLDIIPALKNKNELKLSELVESIEYIQLETRPECLVSGAWKVVGEKYIAICTGASRADKVLLFTRSGKFIRQIGHLGKGPGEYVMPSRIDLSPDENRIIVSEAWKPQVHEYDVQGNHLKTIQLPSPKHYGPYYIDNENIVMMLGRPFTDSIHYPRIVKINLTNEKITPIYFIDHIRNTDPKAGLYANDQFTRNDQGVQFRDCMDDTLFQINNRHEVKSLLTYDIGDNIWPSYVIRFDQEHFDNVGNIFAFPKHLLIIGNYNQERYHQFYEKESGNLYTLPEINDCRMKPTYKYGIINDLDGLKPLWFFGDAYIRNNTIITMHQMVDLKEEIETDCFKNPVLLTHKFRDELRKLVDKVEIDDNPIIRVLHLK